MHIVVMRFVFTVYLIGLAWIFYHSLSELLFSENVKFSTRLGKFFKKVIFSFMWPLSLFSDAGRNKLKKGMRDI